MTVQWRRTSTKLTHTPWDPSERVLIRSHHPSPLCCVEQAGEPQHFLPAPGPSSPHFCLHPQRHLLALKETTSVPEHTGGFSHLQPLAQMSPLLRPLAQTTFGDHIARHPGGALPSPQPLSAVSPDLGPERRAGCLPRPDCWSEPPAQHSGRSAEKKSAWSPQSEEHVRSAALGCCSSTLTICLFQALGSLTCRTVSFSPTSMSNLERSTGFTWKVKVSGG